MITINLICVATILILNYDSAFYTKAQQFQKMEQELVKQQKKKMQENADLLKSKNITEQERDKLRRLSTQKVDNAAFEQFLRYKRLRGDFDHDSLASSDSVRGGDYAINWALK